MKNYKILSAMRLLKSTIEIFVNSFFIMYFLKISDNNIFKLGIYYIIVNAVVYLIIFSTRNICKTKKRINLLRVGILLNLCYFLLIILMKESIVNYIYLMGIIYGLEEGFYYSIYNNFESSGVKNSDRAKFTGIYTALKSIISIIIPLLFGSIINEAGFGECTIIIVILVIFQLICSIIFEDIVLIDESKTNLKKYLNHIKNKTIIKEMYKVCFLNGFIFTGAFSSIVVIYIIKVMNSNLDLGIFTSIFAIITSILGFLFAKVIPKEKYSIFIKISTFLTVIGILLLIYKVNFIIVLLFNLFQTFTQTICNLIIGVLELDMANHKDIKDTYKVEYFTFMETAIFLGRMLGYILFIILGVATNILIGNLVLIIFALLIILLSYYSMRLQNKVIGDNNLE